jgi:hypothetical protein
MNPKELILHGSDFRISDDWKRGSRKHEEEEEEEGGGCCDDDSEIYCRGESIGLPAKKKTKLHFAD